MRLFPLCLLLLITNCDRQPPAARPLTKILAPASAPKTFTSYEEIAPLFQQRNDTTYLINLWATWCQPCLEELPVLQAIAEETRDRPIRFVLLSLDNRSAAIERIPQFLERAGVDLPTVNLATQDTTWGQAIDPEWTGMLPTTIIYRNGLKSTYRRAFLTTPDLRDALRPFLRQ